MSSIISSSKTLATLAALIAAIFFGVILPANASTSPVRWSCQSKLHVMQNVSRQAGLVVGSMHTSVRNNGTPDTWARELKVAQLYELADLARMINSAATDRDFVVAFTARAGYLVADCGR